MRSFLQRPNLIWLAAVLCYILGSVVISLSQMLPFGLMILAAVLWIFLGYLVEKTRKNLAFCGWGLLVTCLLLYAMKESSMQGQLLLYELLVFAAVWIGKREQVDLLVYCQIHGVKPLTVLLVIPTTLLLFVTAGYVNAFSLLFVESHIDTALEALPGHPLLAFVTIACVPAFEEEILFRGLIYRSIRGRWTAILVSAAMFALLHMNFNQMCYAFFMGVVFGLIVSVTDNLTISMLIHLGFNGFSVLLDFLDEKIVQKIAGFHVAGYHPFVGNLTDAAGKVQPSLLALGAVVALLCLGAAFLLLRKISTLERRRSLAGQSGAEGALWRPDAAFFVGSGLCLITAILYEILL